MAKNQWQTSFRAKLKKVGEAFMKEYPNFKSATDVVETAAIERLIEKNKDLFFKIWNEEENGYSSVSQEEKRASWDVIPHAYYFEGVTKIRVQL